MIITKEELKKINEKLEEILKEIKSKTQPPLLTARGCAKLYNEAVEKNDFTEFDLLFDTSL